MDFPVIPKPPTKGDERENYRWQYIVCEVLNGLRSIVLNHNDTVGVAIVDVTSTENTEPKHITNQIGKNWEDHRLDETLHFPYEVTAKTADYAPTSGELVECDCTTGNITITLPTASGFPVIIRKVDASANKVIITGMQDIAFQNTAIQCVYNGSGWIAI
jgi:hypothetical protein